MAEKMKKSNLQLRLERKNRGWTQARLAEAIGADTTLISRWECGERSPDLFYQEKLCTLFNKNATELGFISTTSIPHLSSANMFNDGETKDWAVLFGLKFAQILRDISLWDRQVDSYDNLQIMVDQEIKAFDEMLHQLQAQEMQKLSRRQALVTIAALPTMLLTFANSKQQKVSSFAEEFLPQCAASITACWHLLKGKGFIAIGEILSQFAPMLETIALQPSSHQRAAANLTTQTSIMRGILAMHRLDVQMRERHCKDALRYATISQDSKLQAIALMYLGYTYSHCYYPRQPLTAIPLFQQALQTFDNSDNGTSLLKSDIFLGMGEAYAQCGTEQDALRYISLAQEYFPPHPQYDPYFLYADCGINTLYQWQGKTYLRLVEFIPDGNYQRKAAESLIQSISMSSISERSANETVIYQAEVAKVLGELEMYADYLRQATQMAIEIGSRRRYNDAFLVYQQTPEQWIRERHIQALAKDVFKQLPMRG